MKTKIIASLLFLSAIIVLPFISYAQYGPSQDEIDSMRRGTQDQMMNQQGVMSGNEMMNQQGIPAGMEDQMNKRMDEGMRRGQEMEERGKMMEEKGMEREKQGQERAMMGMKRGIQRFEKSMKGVKRMIEKYNAGGGTTPEALSTAMTLADEIINVISNATSPEEAEEAMERISEVTDVIEEYMPKLAQLPAIKKMIAKAEKELAKLVKKSDQLKQKLARMKVDISGAVSEFDAKIAELRGVLENINSTYGEDPEQAIEIIQDEFFFALEDTWEKYGVLQTLSNIKKARDMIFKAIKQTSRILKMLGDDISPEISEKIDAISSLASEFDSLTGKGAKVSAENVDAVLDIIENIMMAKDELDELLSSDEEFEMPKNFGGNPFMQMMPKFMTPEDAKNFGVPKQYQDMDFSNMMR